MQLASTQWLSPENPSVPAATCCELPGQATNASSGNGGLGRIGANVPEKIGKYEVRELLGRGGQATALLAWDPDLQRDVVLKLYHAAKTPADRAAVLREGQSLVQVQSPFVAQCFAAERHGDVPYLVMEYVRGESLADRLRERPLTLEETLELLEQLAKGLAAVHASGLLHRDLKPSNLLLTADGQPKLIDFGLAAEMGSDQLRQISGTPAYMAPEQASGDVERLDARTDLFGLGAVFYELLTGRPPYLGESVASVWRQAREGRVMPALGRVASLRKDVNDVCMRCLERDPQARFGSANELLEALDVLRHGKRRHWDWTLGWGKLRFRLALGVSVLASIVVFMLALPQFGLDEGRIAMSMHVASDPASMPMPIAMTAANDSNDAPSGPVDIDDPLSVRRSGAISSNDDVMDERRAAKMLRDGDARWTVVEPRMGGIERGGQWREPAMTDSKSLALRNVGDPRNSVFVEYGDFHRTQGDVGSSKVKAFRKPEGNEGEGLELVAGDALVCWVGGEPMELQWGAHERLQVWEEQTESGVARKREAVEWCDKSAGDTCWHYYLWLEGDSVGAQPKVYRLGPCEGWSDKTAVPLSEWPVEPLQGKKREVVGQRAD